MRKLAAGSVNTRELCARGCETMQNTWFIAVSRAGERSLKSTYNDIIDDDTAACCYPCKAYTLSRPRVEAAQSTDEKHKRVLMDGRRA